MIQSPSTPSCRLPTRRTEGGRGGCGGRYVFQSALNSEKILVEYGKTGAILLHVQKCGIKKHKKKKEFSSTSKSVPGHMAAKGREKYDESVRSSLPASLHSSLGQDLKTDRLSFRDIVSLQRHYSEDGLSQKLSWNRYQRFVRKARARWVLPFIQRHHRILDIGCGDGYILNQLRNWIREGVGIDIGRTAIERAKTRYGGTNLSFHISTLEEFQDKEGFHGILFYEVIEHLFSAENGLKKIRSLLKPEGYLAFSTPNVDRLENRMRRFFGRKPSVMPMHVREFTRAEIETLFSSIGLKIVKRKGAQISFWLPGWNRIPTPLRWIGSHNRLSWHLGILFPSFATLQLIVAKGPLS